MIGVAAAAARHGAMIGMSSAASAATRYKSRKGFRPRSAPSL